MNVTLKLPEALREQEQDLTQFLCAKLYEAGKVTLGQAAEACGMKKWDFAETLIRHGVHYLHSSAEADLDNG